MNAAASVAPWTSAAPMPSRPVSSRAACPCRRGGERVAVVRHHDDLGRVVFGTVGRREPQAERLGLGGPTVRAASWRWSAAWRRGTRVTGRLGVHAEETLFTKTRSPTLARSMRRSEAFPKASSAPTTSSRSRPMSARSGSGCRRECRPVRRRTHGHGGDERLGAVTTGHADHVDAPVDGVLRELEQVVAWRQHDRLDPPPPGLLLEVEDRGLPPPDFGLMIRAAVTAGPTGVPGGRCLLQRRPIPVQRVRLVPADKADRASTRTSPSP